MLWQLGHTAPTELGASLGQGAQQPLAPRDSSETRPCCLLQSVSEQAEAHMSEVTHQLTRPSSAQTPCGEAPCRCSEGQGHPSRPHVNGGQGSCPANEMVQGLSESQTPGLSCWTHNHRPRRHTWGSGVCTALMLSLQSCLK